MHQLRRSGVSRVRGEKVAAARTENTHTLTHSLTHSHTGRLLYPRYSPAAARVIKLNDYIPRNRDYYRYKGSLTTPPCTERVLWLVMKKPIPVPSKFLNSLRKMKANLCTKKLTTNHRNIQPFNDRPEIKSCYGGC